MKGIDPKLVAAARRHRREPERPSDYRRRVTGDYQQALNEDRGRAMEMENNYMAPEDAGTDMYEDMNDVNRRNPMPRSERAVTGSDFSTEPGLMTPGEPRWRSHLKNRRGKR